MGSGFFQKLNPLRAIDPAQFFPADSVVGRMSSYDPVVNSGVGKVLSPVAREKGDQYTAMHAQGPGTPGPYAGVTPNLADALSSYNQPQKPAAKPAPAPGTSLYAWS